MREFPFRARARRSCRACRTVSYRQLTMGRMSTKQAMQLGMPTTPPARTEAKPLIVIVEDEIELASLIATHLEKAGMHTQTCNRAVHALKFLQRNFANLVLLDINLPDQSGFSLLEELKAADVLVPIIFLTAHGSVPLSVKAMKAGAVDFLEKPVEDQTLLDAVYQALEKGRQAQLAQAQRRSLEERFATLTPRERQVFEMVAAGKPNKEVAFDLGTAEKTIKVHRAHLMRKLNCQSLAELVRLAQELESK